MTTGTGDTDRPEDLESSVQILIRQGNVTVLTFEGLREDIRKQTRALRWAIGVGLVILLSLGLVVVDNHNRVESLQRKMCPMVTVVIPGPGDPQPPAGKAGDRGRDVIGRATKLAGAFGCR
jgi:hypothetical protein